MPSSRASPSLRQLRSAAGRHWPPAASTLPGVDDQPPHAGQWLSLTAAARELGVSVKTLRRRVHMGTLTSRQVNTRHGTAYEVWLPAAAHNGHSTDQGGLDHGQTMLELVRLVAELQPKAEAAALWQGRCQVLEARVAALEEQLRALPAPLPDVPQDALGCDSERPMPTRQGPAQRPKRPWWRWW
jgi:hypothetical protein